MTLFKKLLILVGSSMLALLLLASTNLYQMRQVYQTTNFANTRVVPGILLLDAALLEFGRIRTHLYRYALNTDSAEMGAQEVEIDKARKQLDATLKAYERLVVDPADKKMFDDERAALAQYNEGVDLIIGLSHGFRREEARTKLAEYDVQAEKLNASLAAHMRHNENVGKTAAADGGTAQSIAIWANVAVCSLGLVSMALLGWTIIRSLTQRLEQANRVVTRIAAGDLGATQLASVSADELGMLLHSVDRMREELAMTISSIIKEADQVVIASGELSGVVRQVRDSAESQSSSAAAAAVAVEQLSTSIDQIDDNAGSASELASRTEKSALASGQSVEQASMQISQVADRVEHTAQQMEALSQQVKEIGNITVVIREVADQTNLLALNAAIEAARAGEQGRGFAVVADEVRKLAERTTASVEEISQMINSIQSGAAMAVSSMQVSHEMVADVAHSASQASGSMAEICDSTQTVRQSIVGISEALSAQRETSQDLSRRVELIAEKSEENSAAVASVATTASRLVSVSDGLKAAVSRFSF